MSPLICYYYVTLKCNSKCKYCNIWQKYKNGGIKEPTLDELETNIRDLKKLGVKLIDFTGGEPLLYPHIIDALKIAKKHKLYTILTTNCLLYSKYAHQLKGLVDLLEFSFESFGNENESAAAKKKHCAIIEGINLAKKIKQNIHVIYTVTNENYENINKLIEFAQKNKFVLILNPCFNYFGNQNLNKKRASMLKKHFKKPFVCLDLAQTELIARGGNKIKKPICKAMSSTIVISPDNQLCLPCFHHCIKKIKIYKNLKRIYQSKEVIKFRQLEGRFDFCDNCAIYCYMQPSFLRNWRWILLSLISFIKFLKEDIKKQF